MSGYLITHKIADPPPGKLLVKIDYTYYMRKSKAGLALPNAAHVDAEANSDGFNLSEWIIRHGEVVRIGKTLQNEYDWYSKDEIEIGDHVHWPIVRFFNYTMLKHEEDYYIIVDYFDIIMRVRSGVISPVNGFYVFTNNPIKKKWGAFETEEYNPWFRLRMIGEEVIYDSATFNYTDYWKVGMDCLLLVPPFKLEADTDQQLDETYYLAQKRHILMACYPDSK